MTPFFQDRPKFKVHVSLDANDSKKLIHKTLAIKRLLPLHVFTGDVKRPVWSIKRDKMRREGELEKQRERETRWETKPTQMHRKKRSGKRQKNIEMYKRR